MPARSLVLGFLRPHRSALLLALSGMLVQTLLALPIPVVHGRVLDGLVAGSGSPDRLAGMLATAVAVTAACLLGRAALGWRVAATMTRVSLEVVNELTVALHRKLQRLPLAFHDRHQTGGLIARLTGDVGTVMIFLNSGTVQLVSDLVLAAGVAAVLVWLDWSLTLLALAVVPAAAIAQAAFAGRLRVRSADTRSRYADLLALWSERLPAGAVVRAFGQERAELARLDDHLAAHTAAGRLGLTTAAWQSATAAVIGGAATAAVVLAGAVAVAAGRLSAGELLAFYALTIQLHAPVVRMAQFQAGAAATRVAVERMAELFDEPEPTVPAVTRPAAIMAVRGRIELADVTFKYRPGGPPALSGVSLDVGPGQTLGIVGPSGSGKSTLLALAAGLYTADGIRLDGYDLSAWPAAELRRAVVLVPQRALLFEGTIRANLAYAAPEVTDGRLWQVLDAVELGDVIRSLPGGLDANLGPGGSGLSGGQRQRLALARALAVSPAVLLLDDSTSALDPGTTARVQMNLDALFPGMTRLIATHNPATVRSADQIVRLSGGRIVESGTHPCRHECGG